MSPPRKRPSGGAAAALRDLGVPKMPKGKRLTPSQKEKLGTAAERAYLERKASIAEISEASGRSYDSIRRLLIDRGVPLRPRGSGARRDKASGSQDGACR